MAAHAKRGRIDEEPSLSEELIGLTEGPRIDRFAELVAVQPMASTAENAGSRFDPLAVNGSIGYKF